MLGQRRWPSQPAPRVASSKPGLPRRYHAHASLEFAGYFAGRGASRRWRRRPEKPCQPRPAFASITYRQHIEAMPDGGGPTLWEAGYGTRGRLGDLSSSPERNGMTTDSDGVLTRYEIHEQRAGPAHILALKDGDPARGHHDRELPEIGPECCSRCAGGRILDYTSNGESVAGVVAQCVLLPNQLSVTS